jgi:hypothetical protein
MSGDDFAALLKELAPPPKEEGSLTFSALPIPGFDPHRLGRTVSGEPALLIAAAVATNSGNRLPPIQLEHISVQHDVTCRVRSVDGSSQEAPFTVIQFSGGDSNLRSYFLRISSSLLVSLGQTPTAQELHKAVHGLVELFRAIARPPQKSIQGLWAEIFVLATASDPVLLAAAWHVSPDDRYDFHGGQDRIEVKSTSGRIRRHRFSLEQLTPPSGTRMMVASVILEQSAGGVSLRELIDRVHGRLQPAPELQGHLDRVVAATLGESLPRALNVRFDWELARDTLSFFPHSSVPTIIGPLPPKLSEVSFVADLSELEPADASAMHEGLFHAAWPLIH